MRSRIPFFVVSLAVAALVAPAARAQIVGPIELETAFRGESEDLASLAEAFAASSLATLGTASVQAREIPNKVPFFKRPETARAFAAAEDAMRQPYLSGTPVPAPSLSFEGTTDDDNAALLGFRVVPPDTEGDVGEDHYVQMNNLVFEIFDKETGGSVLGPLPNNIFFAGTGSLCEQTNSGDPIVLFDHDAERWIFSQFALFDEQNRGHQCFAVSQTEDPLGPYFLYDFVVSAPQFGGIAALNDYPKIGVWRDAYHYTVNEFEFFVTNDGSGFFFVGASAVAFEKEAMLDGEPAKAIKFLIPFTGTPPFHFSLQPSHWEGERRPKKRQPNLYLQAIDADILGGPGDGYFHWAFVPDFDDPSASTFDALGLIPAPPFDADLCGGARNCIEQPPPGIRPAGNGLDTLDIFTMYRAQWRRFKSHDSIVLNHTVDADGNDTAGVRWVELRNEGKGWFIHQTGTFAPQDGNSRWMGSIAQDRAGNIALGYSVSSRKTFPSVRYTGRGRNDPLGQMGMEQSCHEGAGSQVRSFNRWGDYSTMSVDPENECTFWYTNEYYDETAAFDFKTRVCSFTFPDCPEKGEETR